MLLKSIELNAFKSFGRKSTLTFDAPITAVVGPNGSGKSNIVESIRFVLGEQSMKSLRGKGGTDLIFKGSKSMSSASRASVTITFDNRKKVFSFTNSGLGVPLDFDDVTIKREVGSDGVNKYSINDTEVRLKDIVDLLASVNIGSSGHHIISQGEADRILNSSSKDRKAMIEDALGLKVYQYRIKESERKLEKTILNMKEVSALRREIAPHLNFLKKQVEKIEKAESMRAELASLYKEYLTHESLYVKTEGARLTHLRRILDEKLVSVEDRLGKIVNAGREASPFTNEIISRQSTLQNLRRSSGELTRTLGRVEGMLDGLAVSPLMSSTKNVISEEEFEKMTAICLLEIDRAINEQNIESVKSILVSLKDSILSFKEKDQNEVDENLTKVKIAKLTEERDSILLKLQNIAEEETKILGEISLFEKREREYGESMRDEERVKFELLQEKNSINSDMHSLRFEEEKFEIIKDALESEMREASVFVGMAILHIESVQVETPRSRIEQEDMKKKIERIKYRLEDAGLGNSADILKEYKDTEDRDLFLANELVDLDKSIESLKSLIDELKLTLDKEFKEGIVKINKQFEEFFRLMFGGGNAELSLVVEHKKIRKDEELDMEGGDTEEDENNLLLEKGVEINVSLPKKKVKDLNMLSGGERSLTSIALLFAMSQVNPPPFLVLDETDAALDEANSRKYGDMLENLSKYSELIVVTHNRETMSRAEVLYGITIGADGASKLLSIRLEDASVYAK